MKVTLTNFGIWKQQQFSFPDQGSILLTGPSGKGKTTILRAINYALTGSGTKLPTHGEIKCGVTIEYKGLKITRTNRPSRLVVTDADNNSYEDNQAQSMIYQTIGKHFSIAGYIYQKGENSFLCMTPAEKLKFLEKVAFSDVPIEEIKDKVKQICNQHELSLSRIEGEIHVLTQTLVTLPSQPDKTLPLLKEEKSNIDQTIVSLADRINDLQIRIRTSELSSQKRTDLEKRLTELNIPIIPDPIIYKDDLLLLESWTQYDKYQKQMDQREQIEKEYLEPHRKELDLLSSQLEELQITNFSSNDIEELVGMREALFTFQEQIHNDSLRKEYNYDLHLRLQKELPELRSYLTAFIMGKDAKSCPHCKSSLRIVSGSLELFQGSKYSFEQETLLRKDLQEKEKQYKHLNELKIKIDSFPEERIELNQDEIKERIIELEQLQNQHKQTTKTRETISQKFVLTRDNINIKKLKEQYDILSQIQEVPMPSQPKTQLQNNVEQGKKRDQEIVIMTKLVKDTHAKISDIKDQLNKLPLIESIKPLQTDLFLCIDSLEKSRQESFHLIKKIEERIYYDQLRETYLNQQKSLREAKELHLSIQEKFTASKKFREAIQTAELLSIQSLIDEINTHLNQHLTLFFPDAPLTIDVCLFKSNEKTKSIKNQVNLQIGYHGNMVDLSTLSGGEKDRVNLAFTLALAEIFNLPLLMLDETLSSLDQQAVENVLEHIQKEHRLIIIVAHQASSGLFDHHLQI